MHSRLIRENGTTAGFSVVEILVAILVLSFGLLGAAGLQTSALKNNRDARLQSIATLLAGELAEMMRGNAAVASTASSENPYVGSFMHPMTPVVSSDCLVVSTGCKSTVAIAHAEMTDWLARVDAQLPGARATVCNDTAPYDKDGLPQWACTSAIDTGAYVVKVGWTRPDTVGASDKATRPSVVVTVRTGDTL